MSRYAVACERIARRVAVDPLGGVGLVMVPPTQQQDVAESLSDALG